jgi:hypothetical protein
LNNVTKQAKNLLYSTVMAKAYNKMKTTWNVVERQGR